MRCFCRCSLASTQRGSLLALIVRFTPLRIGWFPTRHGDQRSPSRGRRRLITGKRGRKSEKGHAGRATEKKGSKRENPVRAVQPTEPFEFGGRAACRLRGQIPSATGGTHRGRKPLTIIDTPPSKAIPRLCSRKELVAEIDSMASAPPTRPGCWEADVGYVGGVRRLIAIPASNRTGL